MITLPSQSNLKLWVNSENVILSGNKVSTLVDMSSYNNNIVQNTQLKQPIIVNNSLNGLLVVFFHVLGWNLYQIL